MARIRFLLFGLSAAAFTLAGCGGSNSGSGSFPDEDQAAVLAFESPSPLVDGDAQHGVTGQQVVTDGSDLPKEGATGDNASSVESDLPESSDLDDDRSNGGDSDDAEPAKSDMRPTDSFSDDFSSDTLANWTLRHQEADEPPQYTLLDIDVTRSGALTIEPTRTPGWFAGGTAPLVFKSVSGNFGVEVDVLAESAAMPGEPPRADFNSAGLIARDPASGNGTENYVMVNLGRQNSDQLPIIGTESKTTRESNSTLDIQPGTNRGRLILCRIGTDFQSYRLLDNETDWRRIGMVQRPDLPYSLQVGMVANGFDGPDLRATFFEISLRVPQSLDECTPG